MSSLERAIQIAVTAHAGQVDNGGAPYILHPLRVMFAIDVDGDEARIAAVLHDVLEDTDVTAADLAREGFSAPVIEAVEALTRRDGEAYGAFIKRVSRNPIARIVKMADLQDNADLSRIPNPTQKDHKRFWKYQRNIAVLAGLTKAAA